MRALRSRQRWYPPLRWGIALLCATGCGNILGVDQLTERPADGGADAACADAAACTPFPQCGCAPGGNCQVVYADGTTSCSAETTKGLYENCTQAFGSCGVGAQCIGYMCKPFCATDADCPGPNRLCMQVTTDGSPTGIPIPGLKVCTAGCDLLDPSAVCGPYATCSPVPWDGQGHDSGDCVSSQTGNVGTGMGPGTCSGSEQILGVEDCAPGYYCLSSGACAKWCRLGHNEDCTAPMTCASMQKLEIGGVAYGLCN